MPMGGDGPWAISVMWALTGLTLVFVVLRFYARVWVVKSFGIDDHVYNLAFLLLLLYTSATTISAHYGFGQDLTSITNPQNIPRAILAEAIGQTFAVVGMATAKWSLGLFLLRLVVAQWQRVVLWISMACLMAMSISTCFVFWLQCTPPKYLWDRSIKGHCHIDSTPVSMILCIFCVIADFLYAMFPWVFIWKAQIKKREKIVLLASLSLGIIAGACGIKRTMEVPALSSANYLKDTVGLIVWSAAEISVTMVCIGIPVCRPLYKHYLDKLTSRGTDDKYKDPSAPGPGSFPLDNRYAKPGSLPDRPGAGAGWRGDHKDPKSMGIDTYIRSGDNHSEEQILDPVYARAKNPHDPADDGIMVTYEVTTSRSQL